jgi:hypothetical protein
MKHYHIQACTSCFISNIAFSKIYNFHLNLAIF